MSNRHFKEDDDYFGDINEQQLLEQEQENTYDDDETFGDTGPLSGFFSLPPSNNSSTTTITESSRKVTGVFSSLSLDDDHHAPNQMDDDQIESVFKIAMGDNFTSPNLTNTSSVTTGTTTTTTTTISHHHHHQPHQPSPFPPHFQHLSPQQQIYFYQQMQQQQQQGNYQFPHPPPPHIAAMMMNQMPPPHPPSIGSPPPQQQQQQPSNPLLKLMGNLPPNSVMPVSSPPPINEDLKSAYSLSDLEAKFESQTTTTTNENTQPQQPNPPTTPNKTTDNSTPISTPDKDSTTNTTPTKSSRQFNNNNNNNNNENGYYNKQNRYQSRPLTIGDMLPQSLKQQQQSPNKYSNSPNGKTVKNSHDKKYMSAEEIQTINRLQAYQIHYTNPYIEDYYYQRFKMKSTTVTTHTHTPICDSQPKTAPSPKKAADPLSGALGRIPSHSIRAPRPILQIILNNDETEQLDNRNQSSDQTIKLVIESSYTHVLDLEDINNLILNTQDQTLLAEYMEKREPVSNELFKSLHLDPFPHFKFEPPTMPQQDPSQKWPSVCPEDLLFVSLWVIAKGRKLLKRAFPLLTPKQALSGLFAVCRNLPLLLLLHLPEGSEKSTQEIYTIVVKWIMEVPISFFILGFHFLVNFNQSLFIIKLIQTKEGMSVIQTFLTRGLLIFDPMYLAQHNLQLDPVTSQQWRDVFDKFFQRLTGHFKTVFPQNQQPSLELSTDVDAELMPRCIKLSLTSNPDEMLVSWFTQSNATESTVTFSQSRAALTGKFNSPNIVFTFNGTAQTFSQDSDWQGYSHSVVLKNLNPSVTYYYQCGGSSPESKADINEFRTSAFDISDTVTPFVAAVYGDMGYGGGYNNTLALLFKNMFKYSLTIHLGDISYADYDRVEQGNQTVWNDFLHSLQPLTSRMPYMTAPGNHDTFYSFSAYQTTFNMPSKSSATPWYSYNYNGVHFVSFSTESELTPFSQQYQWLKNDLETYRSANPKGWVIAYAHRPYYCSTQWDWCRKQTLRALIESTIGGLFQKYNVDIYLAGHSHAYERTLPVYEQLPIGNYDYPGGTIHFVVGTPGNQEGLDTDWIYPTPSWSASRSAELGYAQLNVVNSTHILWQFIIDKDHSVADEQWIVKGYFD
eukprot:gene2713-3366_t